jgi:hypothetical protein
MSAAYDITTIPTLLEYLHHKLFPQLSRGDHDLDTIYGEYATQCIHLSDLEATFRQELIDECKKSITTQIPQKGEITIIHIPKMYIIDNMATPTLYKEDKISMLRAVELIFRKALVNVLYNNIKKIACFKIPNLITKINQLNQYHRLQTKDILIEVVDDTITCDYTNQAQELRDSNSSGCEIVGMKLVIINEKHPMYRQAYRISEDLIVIMALVRTFDYKEYYIPIENLNNKTCIYILFKYYDLLKNYLTRVPITDPITFYNSYIVFMCITGMLATSVYLTNIARLVYLDDVGFYSMINYGVYEKKYLNSLYNVTENVPSIIITPSIRYKKIPTDIVAVRYLNDKTMTIPTGEQNVKANLLSETPNTEDTIYEIYESGISDTHLITFSYELEELTRMDAYTNSRMVK